MGIIEYFAVLCLTLTVCMSIALFSTNEDTVTIVAFAIVVPIALVGIATLIGVLAGFVVTGYGWMGG